jgi:hypothetical protein
LLTDGDPLVNTLSWSAAHLYRRELEHDDERLLDTLRYLTGERRIPLDELPYYLRRAWPLAVTNRVHLARFGLPDLIVLLQIEAPDAMRRIRQRGRPLQGHETAAFLTELAGGYERVCRVIEDRCDVPVIRIAVDRTSQAEAARIVADAILERIAVQDAQDTSDIAREGIDVIATTISGSLGDQRKVDRIGPEFRSQTTRPVRVHIARSHVQARALAKDVVSRGGRIVVSAGGAGTFNAVLEGCHLDDGMPAGLRLAFLRKGSADLIGKTLGVPDGLADAVAAICDGIEMERCVTCDVLAIEARDSTGASQVRHLVGFGGLGVFGEVPRFTEARFVKFYKGILGSLFGDYGPFYVGLALAAAWWIIQRGLGRVAPIVLELDGDALGPLILGSVIIVNGDLGPAFPLGRGLRFSSGTFRVVALRDVGLRGAVGQAQAARSGHVLDDPTRYACDVRDVSDFVARPLGDPRAYRINVDGLGMSGFGTMRVRVTGSVSLVAGPDVSDQLVDHAASP